ncbi:MAG: proline racemase family protein [Trinickia sp.]
MAPRGVRTIFYPPLTDNADFSLLFIETSGCLPMCGHATTQLGSGLDAVLPSIEGRTWMTGRGQHFVDDAQPYAHGFSLQGRYSA